MTDLTRPEADPDEGPAASPEQEARVRALLAALPAEAMPADVWARLEASLAAEPPLVDTAAEPPLVSTAAEPPLVDTAAEPPLVSTAAEPPLVSTAAEPPLVDAAPVADLQAARERRDRGRRWLGAVAGVAAAAVAVAVGVQVMGRPSSTPVAGSATQGNSAPQPDRGVAEAAAVPVVASGTTYQQASFADQATDVARAVAPEVAESLSPSPLPPTDAPDPAATGTTGFKSASDVDTAGTFAATPEGVRDCAVAVSGTPSVRVLVVDLATYAGRPVAVLVLSRTEPALDAWVVGRGCTSADPQVVAHQPLAQR